MNIENINKDSVIGLIKKYDKEYKINLMILTVPLSLNPEPIDENYHKILDFYKSADIFNIEGENKLDSVCKLINMVDSKKAEGINIGYLMPHILYILELLNDISKMFECVSD